MNKIHRKDEIIRLSTDKKVLHLGFIQHSHLWEIKIKQDDWLHSKLHDVASKLVGVDYLTDEVNEIKEQYCYDVYSADVMYLDDLILSEKFDVIICGELIEHIENPGLMLDGIKRFMHEKSILIITTPNPWRKLWIHNMSSGIMEDKWLNKEHVSWYSFQTLKQLLQRKGYSEVKYQYYTSESNNYAGNRNILIKTFNQIKEFMLDIYCMKRNSVQNYQGLFFVAALKGKEEK
jgi:ubiquinone/menaquinone biosynthesis C-methylase UbiE